MRTLESALHRGGLGPVAGVDEVGRGACAGPLVVAACVLGPGRIASLAALDDSKKLSEQAREKLFPLICRYAVAYHVVFIPSAEVDRRGVHVANIEGMRRAVAGLAGVGDLVATCTSPRSRNRSFGERLGRGETLQSAGKACHVVEGVTSCESVLALASSYDVEMPLTDAVHRVCHKGLSVDEAITLLLGRRTKPE